MINKLRTLGITIEENCDMSKHTTFKVGGKAKYLITVENIKELKETLQILTEEGIKYLVIGNGSNLIFRDEGYDGAVVSMSNDGEFSKVEINGTTAIAGAKVLMSTFAKALLTDELGGFEALSGIPGSIGGATFMNAGAYGSEIKDLITKVHAVSFDGKEERDFLASELKMGYRRSVFMDNGYIITDVMFELSRDNQETIKEKMAEYSEMRNSKQPLKYPSAGSFFKRPEGYFAGKLIEDSGLKGLTVGGAQVSTLHAGFLINTGNATATDVIKLMRLIQNTVYDKYQVKLEPEVRII